MYDLDQSNKGTTEMQNLLKHYKSCCYISNACILLLLSSLNGYIYEHYVLQSFMDHRLLILFSPEKGINQSCSRVYELETFTLVIVLTGGLLGYFYSKMLGHLPY